MARRIDRVLLPLIVLVAVAVLTACSDDTGSESGASVDADASIIDEGGEDASDGGTEASGSDGSGEPDDVTTTSATSDPGGATTSASVTAAPSTAPSGRSTVRVGPVVVERTEPCPPLTVAPTFALAMSSDAGPDNAGPGQASEIDVAEGAPTTVADDTTFTVTGDWSLNVQMLEHLSGTTRGTVHTASSRLEEEINIDGVPIIVSWDVTENGDQVTFSNAQYEVSPSCVQILTGTIMTFTDGDGTQTVGSINPSGPQPIDLPLDRPVTVFGGATFEAASTAGWTLNISVIDHWNGRNYHSDAHTAPESVAVSFPTVAAGDQVWQLRYAINTG